MNSGDPSDRLNSGQSKREAVLANPRRRSQRAALKTLNCRLAKSLWENIPANSFKTLSLLTGNYGFSVGAGDLQFLDGRWYVTHSGLLSLAYRRRCCGIETGLQQRASDPVQGRWVFKATVFKSELSKRFVGYADAEPSNVAPMVRGAELRIAETRAVNRALRKAYGIGICSVEELGASNRLSSPSRNYKSSVNPLPQNGSGNGQLRLKDKLCLLIRQHNLDPTLVKGYAAHFCGTGTLSGASRELVESFIAHLEKEARENRDGLLCKLNSFSQSVEVHS